MNSWKKLKSFITICAFEQSKKGIELKMEETKEVKNKEEKKTSKKAKHKAKLSIGDIIFRALMLIIIILIAVMVYIFYLQQITHINNLEKVENVTVTAPINNRN